MQASSQRDKAEAFRRLHQGPPLLVLPNAWDVVTARLVVAAGYPAVATSSAAIAWAHGYPDGEHIGRDTMLAAVARIAAAVPVPVTADVEAGYGPSPEAAGATARGVIAAGAVGLNLEDGTNEGRLLDLGLQVERIRAVREAGAAAGVPLVINARTDAFELTDRPPEARFAEAVRRANAYRAAGADSLFVIHVSDGPTIGRLAREVSGPLNVLAGPPAPPLAELERLGVRRASLGPRLAQAALGLVRRALAGLAAPDGYAPLAEFLIPFPELQRLMAPGP